MRSHSQPAVLMNVFRIAALHCCEEVELFLSARERLLRVIDLVYVSLYLFICKSTEYNFTKMSHPVIKNNIFAVNFTTVLNCMHNIV